MERMIYSFNEDTREMYQSLGIKGANLAEMTKLGLPVPFGFTITTEVCKDYYEKGHKLSEETITTIYEKIKELEQVTKKGFGNEDEPLLVSVRSSSEISVPGIVESVLNLGLNDKTVEGLGASFGDLKFAYDCYRNFIQSFGRVAYNIRSKKFEKLVTRMLNSEKVQSEDELSLEKTKELVAEYKELFLTETKTQFPQDVKEQLTRTIEAIFDAWNRPASIMLRKLNGAGSITGTAVTIQNMVFGNRDQQSCSGVVSTRNPFNGEKELFGEFFFKAQGNEYEEGLDQAKAISCFEEYFPQNSERLFKIAKVLEQHYKDMQDVEFVIEQNKLYVLQTRNGKRSANGAVKIAVDLAKEGLITRKDAVMRLTADQIDHLVHPTFDLEQLKEANKLVQGIAASPGAACGRVCFDVADSIQMASKGEKVILVKFEFTQEDLQAIMHVEGILSGRGGRTAYVAVMARGLGKCYVSGCSSMKINEEEKTVTIGDKIIKEGEYISINGSDGMVYQGQIGTVMPKIFDEFITLSSWADELRTLKVRANVDNPKDAKLAVEFGAEGIGLCRTEHMFYGSSRLAAVQRMILADSESQRKERLASILPFQRKDFKGIFEAMEERPVTIRLLDPPFHEFLPRTEEEIRELATQVHIAYDKLVQKIDKLREFNPMLGHRGCRLAVTYPEIAQMQTEAIVTAAIEVRREKGYDIIPEIMIPLASDAQELAFVKKVVTKKIEEIMDREDEHFKCLVGTMIEIPRAAFEAKEIAKEADFFSFGTNDLTQMTYGFSRDDAGRLIREYRRLGILEEDPFQTLDVKGVGELIEIAISRGKMGRNNMKFGVCGEHGGDPKSIEFFQKAGVNYVSCSPYRVPIARLAAAQAAIRNKK